MYTILIECFQEWAVEKCLSSWPSISTALEFCSSPGEVEKDSPLGGSFRCEVTLLVGGLDGLYMDNL